MRSPIPLGGLNRIPRWRTPRYRWRDFPLRSGTRVTTTTTTSRFIIIATIIVVLLILIALLRAIVAPLYLIGSVLISYLSALGIGVIVFQFILGQELHWSVPGLTFIMLVAVGADYNMLLISRIRDESPHGVRSGVIRTVGSTGGVITAAGLIFAASMFGLVFASISTMVQAGFVLGIGHSAGYLPGAHHHGAGHRRAGRASELVAVTMAAAAATHRLGGQNSYPRPLPDQRRL